MCKPRKSILACKFFIDGTSYWNILWLITFILAWGCLVFSLVMYHLVNEPCRWHTATEFCLFMLQNWRAFLIRKRKEHAVSSHFFPSSCLLRVQGRGWLFTYLAGCCSRRDVCPAQWIVHPPYLSIASVSCCRSAWPRANTGGLAFFWQWPRSLFCSCIQVCLQRLRLIRGLGM